MLLAAGAANAQAYGSGVDGQSVFRVSNTLPVVVTSASAVSPKLSFETRVVRLTCTQDCHFKVGIASVSATISNSLLMGGSTEYFKVNATGPNYIGVIRDTADGKLFIDEMIP